MTDLFHVSEEPGIGQFDPRRSEYTAEPVVWAIDADHLRNCLLPRDCPRVTFYAGPRTTAEDRRGFLGESPSVVAIEQDWLERVRKSRLYCYRMPPRTFACLDECAGYFVSRESVRPVKVELLEDPLSEIRRRGTEFRILPDLWPLRDAVASSSLQFSMIRMRNAKARSAAGLPPAIPGLPRDVHDPEE